MAQTMNDHMKALREQTMSRDDVIDRLRYADSVSGLSVHHAAIKAALAALSEQPEAQAGGAEEACYQAYQAVGVMLSDLGLFDTERGQNLLDNLSQARVVHDVLPWDSTTQRQ